MSAPATAAPATADPAVQAHDRPLTLGQLVDLLGGFLLSDPGMESLPVTFGPDALPVAGGVVFAKAQGSYLNLAPMRLDRAGGF